MAEVYKRGVTGGKLGEHMKNIFQLQEELVEFITQSSCKLSQSNQIVVRTILTKILKEGNQQIC